MTAQRLYPDTTGQREKVASEIETVGWAILQALHEGVEDGPQSWSDMASDQEKRIKKAAIAAIEAVTDLAQFNAQGFSWPPQPLAPAQPALPPIVDRAELVALLEDLASVNLSREACARQAARMADDLIARGLTFTSTDRGSK